MNRVISFPFCNQDKIGEEESKDFRAQAGHFWIAYTNVLTITLSNNQKREKMREGLQILGMQLYTCCTFRDNCQA